MSREQDRLLIDAVQQGNVKYLQDMLSQGYLDKNRTLLYRLAWIAAENNSLESERILKQKILKQFHPKLSVLSFQIAAGEFPDNLNNYARRDLIDALEIARFTKQPLEVRAQLIEKLIVKYDYSEREINTLDFYEAKRIHNKYLGAFPPLSARLAIGNSMIALGVLLIIGSIVAGIVTTLMGMGPLTMLVVAAMIIPGLGFLAAGTIQVNKPAFRCADNLIGFATEGNIIGKSAFIALHKANTVDINNRFKITAEAEANINKLENISPGIIKDLSEHFSKRVELAEKHAVMLGKDRETGMADNTEIKKLLSDWQDIMHSAAEGSEEFCAEVSRYLRTFEADQKNVVASASYEDGRKTSLIFATLDKKIDEHITKIEPKTNLKL